jgi:hypothetical protein
MRLHVMFPTTQRMTEWRFGEQAKVHVGACLSSATFVFEFQLPFSKTLLLARGRRPLSKLLHFTAITAASTREAECFHPVGSRDENALSAAVLPR